MKLFFKKYMLLILIAFVINLPILLICCIRTDKTVTLKGDTTVIDKFVEVDNEYVEKGSFSSIYVISFDHSTIFQNMILSNSKINDVDDMSESYLHFSNNELSQMSKIQHDSSINYALICAYSYAKEKNPNIVFDYSFNNYTVAYYGLESEFRNGDKIIGVNDVYAKDDFAKFKELFNYGVDSKDGNTEYIVNRDGLTKKIKNTTNNMKIGGYSMYDISETVSPSYKIKNTNVGGPSGGLLQTLAIYNSLVEEDITKGLKIAGTGTINANGEVGAIGGIKQKVHTANDDNMDIFLCPSENYQDALEAYNTIKNPKMKLYEVKTFFDALEVLKNA